MSIGTLANARQWGASGTDVEVQAALDEALERVERFCGDEFHTTTEARVLRVLNGFALAPCRLQSVTSVATYGTGATTVPASAWRLVPVSGGPTSGPNYFGIELALTGGDGLIVGAEPWNGGWASFWGRYGGEYVEVAGVWGWSGAPATVARAVEALAGSIAGGAYVPAADAEGNAQGYPDGYTPATAREPAPEPVAPAGRAERTTGNAAVDRMLIPYRRALWRIG